MRVMDPPWAKGLHRDLGCVVGGLWGACGVGEAGCRQEGLLKVVNANAMRWVRGVVDLTLVQVLAAHNVEVISLEQEVLKGARG